MISFTQKKTCYISKPSYLSFFLSFFYNGNKTGIPEALALSVKMGLLSADKLPKNYKRNRVMTEQEMAQALDDARRKGLPKGWTVMWGINENKRIWVSPNGQRKCN